MILVGTKKFLALPLLLFLSVFFDLTLPVTRLNTVATLVNQFIVTCKLCFSLVYTVQAGSIFFTATGVGDIRAKKIYVLLLWNSFSLCHRFFRILILVQLCQTENYSPKVLYTSHTCL